MGRDMNVGPAAEKKLEQYGVWVKVEPRDVSSDRQAPVKLADLEQLVPGAPEKAADISEEEEQLLGDLGAEMAQEETEAPPAPSAESGAAAVPEELELEELPEEEQVEVPLAEETGEVGRADRFDDLEALQDQLAAPSAAVPSAAPSPGALARIEAELRSIRADLTMLKKELAGLHRAAPRAAAGESAAAREEATGGFFEEEEDDTIALTGDELDNILNTADITEESAEAPAVEADLSAGLDVQLESLPEGALSDQPDILAPEEPAPAPVPVPAAEAGAETPVSLEEIPSELVLDELVEAAPAEKTEEVDLDLEGIPEVEEASEIAPAAEEDLGELEEVEEAAELEEPAETTEGGPQPATEEPSPAAAAQEPQGLEDVDLEALTLEQETGAGPVLSKEDISDEDIAELEAVAEDETPPDKGKPIEIDFEGAEPVAEPAAELVAEPVEEVEAVAPVAAPASAAAGIPDGLKDQIRKVLKYMDQLLEALPEEKIQEFARSDYFSMYRKLFEDLGLGS